MNIKQIDHLVLTVKDIKASIAFYQNIMGMELIHFENDRTAMKFGQQKINLREQGEQYEPAAVLPQIGSADLCFIAESPLDQITLMLQEKNIPILDGPIHKCGAQGRLVSIYIHDPDRNLIEISNPISL